MGMVKRIFSGKRGGKVYKINGISVSVKNQLEKSHIADKMGISPKHIKNFIVLKKAIDARKKNDVCYVYSVAVDTDVELEGFEEYTKSQYAFKAGKKLDKRPVIIGMGPCGLFAGLMLSEAGYRPIILERGADVDTRIKSVEEFWQNGILDIKTNVQFGEGGAGTFSDGKLNSGIHDSRCQFVLDTFAKYGADIEITYTAKPHIGTDVLSSVVKNIRSDIVKYGGEVRFFSQVTEIIADKDKVTGVYVNDDYVIETDNIILAIGHSARDTYRMVKRLGVEMEQKNFSVGVRIEHSQKLINDSQYGVFAKYLDSADYKLSAHLENGRSVYTFCMCPGGVVVASTSEEGSVVTNGMSYSARDGENANSAVLVNVTSEDFETDDVLSGVDFQEKIEKKAYVAGGSNYFAPCQYLADFIGTKTVHKVVPTYKPGIRLCEIKEIFPEFITNSLKEGILKFDRKIKGFADGGAVITAPETRSSAPVRILRNKETFMSNIKGLFPAGEGAGYAGGIMSAAVDGIRVSEALVKEN